MGSTTNSNNLKQTVAKGFFWGGLSNILCQALNLFFGIFLARILGPDDYGPIGILAFFSAIASSLQDSGFVSAIANRKEVTHDDYNAVFWFNLVISFIMYGILYSCAPLIADYFNQPILVDLSRYNFLGFVVASFGIVPSAYLFRELKVKERAIAQILSVIATGLTGTIMALNGYSYWGIATQSIVYVLVRTIVCWYFTPWHPTLQVKFYPSRYLFAFGYRLMLTGIFQRFNWNLLSLILGKHYTNSDVGNYTKSAAWFNMGGEVVNGMVNAVGQPTLAKIADDCERQLRVFRKMLRFTAFVAFPLMFGLSLVAPDVITIVITDKWLESAYMLRILAVWGAFMPLQSLFTNLLISCGRSRIFMWCTIVQGMLMLAILLMVYPYGIPCMLMSYCVFNACWLFVWRYFASKEIAVTLVMFLLDVVPYMLLAAATMFASYFLTAGIGDQLILLLSRIAVAVLLYLSASALMRSKELYEIIDFLFKRKKASDEKDSLR